MNASTVLREDYGIKPSSIAPINKQSTNQNYVVHTDDDAYFLKRFHRYAAMRLEHIKTHMSMYRALQGSSVPAPDVIETVEGDLAVKRGGTFWAVLEHVDGEPDDTRGTMIQDDARVLAAFHNALESFKPDTDFYGESFEDDIDTLTRFVEPQHNYADDGVLPRAHASSHPFSERVLRDKEKIFVGITKAIHRIWHPDFSRRSVLHYDFKPENLLHDDGDLQAVVDFDYSKRDPVELDVAKAAKAYALREDNTVDYNRYKEFVKAYEQVGECSTDWDLHYGLLLFIVLRRLVMAAWEVLDGNDLFFLYEKDEEILLYLLRNKMPA